MLLGATGANEGEVGPASGAQYPAAKAFFKKLNIDPIGFIQKEPMKNLTRHSLLSPHPWTPFPPCPDPAIVRIVRRVASRVVVDLVLLLRRNRVAVSKYSSKSEQAYTVTHQTTKQLPLLALPGFP